eukprot:6201784-Pleurochrysis_carterae.AAC.1
MRTDRCHEQERRVRGEKGKDELKTGRRGRTGERFRKGEGDREGRGGGLQPNMGRKGRESRRVRPMSNERGRREDWREKRREGVANSVQKGACEIRACGARTFYVRARGARRVCVRLCSPEALLVRAVRLQPPDEHAAVVSDRAEEGVAAVGAQAQLGNAHLLRRAHRARRARRVRRLKNKPIRHGAVPCRRRPSVHVAESSQLLWELALLRRGRTESETSRIRAASQRSTGGVGCARIQWVRTHSRPRPCHTAAQTATSGCLRHHAHIPSLYLEEVMWNCGGRLLGAPCQTHG